MEYANIWRKKIVMQFSACKNHARLYVGEKAMEHFSLDLYGYKCRKSAVYLPYSQPLPETLIAKMVLRKLAGQQIGVRVRSILLQITYC